MIKKQPLYIYCIANISEDEVKFGKGGIENETAEITTIKYKDISAVVSPGEIKQYRPTRKNNLIHQGTIETVMKEYNVLPFRFGIVSNGREEVVVMLKEKYDRFIELLAKIENRIEMGVKVTYGDVNEFLGRIGEDNQKIKGMKQSNKDISKNQSMIIEVGKIIEKELNSISAKMKSDIYERLSTFADSSIINENLSTEMILNASFLIKKEKESELDEIIVQLDKKYEGKLNFKCAGPFPPYNFVKL